MAGPSRRVASARALRLTAWASAAAAFLATWGIFGSLPAPRASTITRPNPPQTVVVRKILRRVVVHERAAPVTAPTVTYVPSPSGSAAPPPATTTGGS